MSSAHKFLLLLSVAVLHHQSTSRSTLELFQELKNRLFVSNNSAPPTQKPDMDTSTLENDGAGYQQNTTVNENFNDTADNDFQEQFNATSTHQLNNSEIGDQFLTNGTIVGDTEYTQYYNEQEWNSTTVNGTTALENNDNKYESKYFENSQNETNYYAYDDSSASINTERANQTENIRKKRDTTNINYKNTTMTDTGSLANKPVNINTTVFTEKSKNSPTTAKSDQTNGSLFGNQKIQKMNDEINKIDYNNSNDSSSGSVNSTETIILKNIQPINNNTTTDNLNTVDVRNETSSNETTMVLSDIETVIDAENRLTDTNASYNQINPNFRNTGNVSLENVTSWNISEPNSQKINSTDSESLYSYTTVSTGKNVFSDAIIKKYTSINETEDTLNLTETDSHKYFDDLQLENDISVNETSVTTSTTIISIKHDTDRAQNNTDNFVSETRKTTEINTPISDNVTNELYSNLTKFKNVLINSTQVIGQFFQNITQDLYNLVSSVPIANITQWAKKLSSEHDSLEATTQEIKRENIIEFEDKNVKVNINETINPEILTTGGQENKTKNNVTTITSMSKNDAINVSKVSSNNNIYLNNDQDLNTTDYIITSSNVSFSLENNSTEQYSNKNVTLKRINTTAVTTTRKDRAKRSVVLTIGTFDDATIDNLATTDFIDNVTNPTVEFLGNTTYNTTEFSQWNETINIDVVGPVCNIQNEKCNQTTDCCENFECVTTEDSNSTSYCNLRPEDPYLPTPLPDVAEPTDV